MNKKRLFNFKIKRNLIQVNFVKFGLFLNLKSSLFAYFLSFIIGIIGALNIFLFTKGPNLYSEGIGGLAQGIARIFYIETNDKNLYILFFWALYGVFNLPLFFISWFKIAHRFTIITIIYLITSVAFGLILDYFVPTDSYFRNIFGDVSKLIRESDKEINAFYNSADNIDIAINNWIPTVMSSDSYGGNITAIILMLVYTIFSIIFSGALFAFLYMMGGSAAGTDIIAFWFADKSRKPVGVILTIISNLSMFLGYILGSYIPFGIKTEHWEFWYLLSPVLVITMLDALFTIKFYISIFPKDKLIEVKVITEHGDDVLKKLTEEGYTRGFTIMNGIGGRTNREKKIITTILRYYELIKILSVVKQADKLSFTQISYVSAVIGNYPYQTTEEIEKTYYTITAINDGLNIKNKNWFQKLIVKWDKRKLSKKSVTEKIKK